MLLAVWATAFQATDLPFLPLIAAGGILTGLAGLWVRHGLVVVGDGPVEARRPFPRIAVTRRQVLLALVVAFVHLLASHALFAIGSSLLPGLAPTAEQVYGRAGGVPLWWALLIGGALTAPLEEVFWRGAVHPLVTAAVAARRPRPGQTRLARMVPLAVSALLYAGFHVSTGHVALVAAALLGGLVWGWLLDRTGSLGATMIAHATWACGILLFSPV